MAMADSQGCDLGLSPARISVTLFFHNEDDEPVYVSGDFNNWQIQEMTSSGPGLYQHTLSVLDGTRFIRFKYRVGNSTWVHDEDVSVEPDGFGGFNNRLDVQEYAHEQHDPMAETVMWNSPALRPSGIFMNGNDESKDLSEADELRSVVSDYLSGSEYEMVSLHSDAEDTNSVADFMVI